MASKKKNEFEFGPPMRNLADSYAGPDGFALESDAECGSILLMNTPNGQTIAIWSLEQAEFIRDAMDAVIKSKALPKVSE